MKVSSYALASICGLLAVAVHPTSAFAHLSSPTGVTSVLQAQNVDLIPPTPVAPGEAASAFETYVQKTYGRYPLTIKRGEGCRLFDEDDKSYLDFVAGIGASVLIL